MSKLPQTSFIDRDIVDYLTKNLTFFDKNDNQISTIEGSIYAKLGSSIIKPHMSSEDIYKCIKQFNFPFKNDKFTSVEHEFEIFNVTIFITYPDNIDDLKFTIVNQISFAIEMTDSYMLYSLSKQSI